MKKLLILLSLIVISCLAVPLVGAQAVSAPALNVVVLIDQSGTMPTTDPNMIALEAAKLFVDLCEMRSTNLAIIGFTDQPSGEEADRTFKDVSTSQQRESLRDQIDTLTPDHNGDTGIGEALEEAWRLIDAQKAQSANADDQYAILLITDGEISFSVTEKRQDARRTKEEASRKKADRVAEDCRADGITIYCIGICDENSTATPDWSDLESWATSYDTYSVVDSATDLPDLLTSYFVSINESQIIDVANENGDLLSYEFEVERNSFEANISIAKSKGAALNIDDLALELYNPDGDRIPLSNNRGLVVCSTEKSYVSIKLIEPVPGLWKLKITNTISPSDIKVTCVINSDLHMDLTLDSAEIYKNAYVNATVTATQRNKPYFNAAQAVYLDAYLDGALVSSDAMTYDENTEQYACFFQVTGQAGQYTYEAHLQTAYRNNLSNIVTLNVLNHPITSAQTLEDVELKQFLPASSGILTVDSIEALFYDADGDPYTTSVSGGDGIFEIDQQGDQLYLRGISAGTAKLTITATCEDGTAYAISCNVVVINQLLALLPYAIAGVVLILLCILLIRASKKPFKRNATLTITIIDGTTGAQYQGSTLLIRYGKKAVSMAELARNAGIQFGSMPHMGETLEKIKVSPAANGIFVKSKKKGTRQLSSGGTYALPLDSIGQQMLNLEYTH